jgi:tRNA pseudouridine55 synthase
MSPVDGLILADKPAGITSHDMVARARNALGRRRVGHAGTLDPFATGLLILLVGRATRVQRYLMAQPKTYEVIVRFGATSTTGDTEGEITETGVVPAFPLDLPTGALRQRPPAHSAVKVDGERAYARARRGETVVPDERTVEVHEFTTIWQDGDRAGLRIVCGSGTYVRSLVADLGDAYCLELRRTAIGPFGVDGGWPGVGRAEVTDLQAALRRIMPVVELAGDEARTATHGRAIALPEWAGTDPGGVGPEDEADHPRRAWDHALLVDSAGPIAVAELRDGGLLKPVVGFRA